MGRQTRNYKGPLISSYRSSRRSLCGRSAAAAFIRIESKRRRKQSTDLTRRGGEPAWTFESPGASDHEEGIRKGTGRGKGPCLRPRRGKE